MFAEIALQDTFDRFIARDKLEMTIKHHHAGRHVGQHGFKVSLGVFQRGAIALDSRAGIEQLLRHQVE